MLACERRSRQDERALSIGSSIAPLVPLALAVMLALAAGAGAAAAGPESMSAKTLPEYKSAERNASLLWGSYRPNVYFGLRTRHPESLLTGLMWFDPDRPDAIERARHRCEHGRESGLEGYGWEAHDGATFGRHVADDAANGVVVTASFVKARAASPEADRWGGDLGIRIRVEPRAAGRGRGGAGGEGAGEGEGRSVALLFYVALQSEEAWAALDGAPKASPKGLEGGARLDGYSPDVGRFSLVVPRQEEWAERGMPLPRALRKFKQAPDTGRLQFAGLRAPPAEAWRAEERLKIALHGRQARLRHLLRPPGGAGAREAALLPGAPPVLPNEAEANGTVWAFQLLLQAPAQLDLALVSHAALPSRKPAAVAARAAELTGEALTAALEAAEAGFEGRFEAAFGLRARKAGAKAGRVARYALANLLGGMGYFHGRSIVLGEAAERPPASLFTAVPSRPFFPRGFLWDEGFHQLLVARFDPLLAYDVLARWLALQEPDGWIAREQILGEEARSKVPPEFRAQNREHANPPSFTLALDALLRAAGPPALRRPAPMYRLLRGEGPPPAGSLEGEGAAGAALAAFVAEAHGPLRRHLDWLLATQAGDAPGTFRWRGRSPDGVHTLASGLDDYPRASTPLDTERHVDLLCWVAATAETLARAAALLPPALASDAAALLNHSRRALVALDEHHWNGRAGLYADFVAPPEHLRQLAAAHAERLRGLDPRDPADLERLRALPPVPTTPYVEHAGYVNLFPLLFGAIPPDSPRLKATLDLLHDPQRLWSPYGLRSLALADPLFGKGENYWRGPVWVNVNYLALRALKLFYAEAPGPQRERAAAIYGQLRANLVANVAREFERTGYVWEQYSGTTGEGLKSHPFTGWSALVALVAAEIY